MRTTFSWNFIILRKFIKLILKNYCHRWSIKMLFNICRSERQSVLQKIYFTYVLLFTFCHFCFVFVTVGKSFKKLMKGRNMVGYRTKFVVMTCRGTKNRPPSRGGQKVANSAKMTKNWHTCPDNSDVIAKKAKLISLW